MAVRKGIKPKILAHFVAGEVLTGRQVEKLYIEYGGSAPNGRVSWDTLRHMMGALPIRRVKKTGEKYSLLRDKFELHREHYEQGLEHDRIRVSSRTLWSTLTMKEG